MKILLGLFAIPVVLALSLVSAAYQKGRAVWASLHECAMTRRIPPPAPRTPISFEADLKANWPRAWSAHLSFQAPSNLPGLEAARTLRKEAEAMLRDMRLRRDFDKVFDGMEKPKEVRILESDFWDNRHLLIFYEYCFEIALSVPRDSSFRSEYLEELKEDLHLSRIEGLDGLCPDHPWFAPGEAVRYEVWRSTDGNAWVVYEREGERIFLKNSQL